MTSNLFDGDPVLTAPSARFGMTMVRGVVLRRESKSDIFKAWQNLVKTLERWFLNQVVDSMG
jgi:hypothetical protein